MRSWKVAAAGMLVVAVTASPAYACRKVDGKVRHRPSHHNLSWQDVLFGGIVRATENADKRAEKEKAALKAPGPVDLSAYEGLASWVDIFNHRPWDNPSGAVKKMAKRGAEAIFLQTSTYGQGGGIYDEDAVDEFLYHAHKRGMKVIAWYVPSFDQQDVDFRRIKRAIRYTSPSGHRFDSFALDIEATNVSDIGLRNKRLVKLSNRIRREAGAGYPLGAITPDPIASLYWPDFPYKEVADRYDVFVPMGYFTFRADGYKEVKDYTAANIKKIRKETGTPDVPIHFIGGIADDAEPAELKGFVKAAREKQVMGASLYDYPITSRRSWYELRALNERIARARRVEAAAEAEAEAERRRLARKKAREARAERRAKDGKRRAKKDGKDEGRKQGNKKPGKRSGKNGRKR
ncbi:MAG TPA: hypothetical protein VJ927_06575 [Actinomycetota bacterium]|nr:hypothetical protein [Actinomycetota bacterium]